MSKHALLKNKNKQKYFAGGQDLINQIIDFFFLQSLGYLKIKAEI